MSTGIQLADPEIIAYVGSGEDYESINDALVALSKVRQAYVSGGRVAEVRLVSGFSMDEVVDIRRQDLGWIVIQSDEPTVVMSDTSQFSATENAVMPVLGTVFDMESPTPDDDHWAYHLGSSRGTVLPGCGIINARGRGASVTWGSVFSGGAGGALGSVWTGAGTLGVRISNSSVGYLRGVDVSNAVNNAVGVGNGCLVGANGADLSGAGNHGIYTSGAAFVSAIAADLSGAGTHGAALLGNGGGIINVTGAMYTSLSHVPNLLTGDGIIIDQAAPSLTPHVSNHDGAGTSLGSVNGNIEVFDEDGNSLGFIPTYDAIT